MKNNSTINDAFAFDWNEVKDCATTGKCETLFQAFREHYHSSEPVESGNVTNSSLTESGVNTTAATITTNGTTILQDWNVRYSRFKKSVQLVYQHNCQQLDATLTFDDDDNNSNITNISTTIDNITTTIDNITNQTVIHVAPLYNVTLNHLADVISHVSQQLKNESQLASQTFQSWEHKWEYLWDDDDDDTGDNNATASSLHTRRLSLTQNQQQQQQVQDDESEQASSFFLIKFSTPEDIHRHLVESQLLANPNPPLEDKYHLLKPTKNYRKHSKTTEATKEGTLYLPAPIKVKMGASIATEETLYPFGGSVSLPPELPEGAEVKMKFKKSLVDNQQPQPQIPVENSNNAPSSLSSPPVLPPPDSNVTSSNSTTTDTDVTSAAENRNSIPPIQEKDKFASSLNWATANNPDKVPLVHSVFDQKSCGSCWAYAATGSLEASVARRAAQAAYSRYMDELENADDDDDDVDDNASVENARALQYARKIEASVFARTNLSVQELIDCDTQADQGCIGGNPLVAYFYIHRHGLVSWKDYPYTASEQKCLWKQKGTTGYSERKPVATVDSWGILPRNHENMIQLALRYIGPVAVGINGADPLFMLYSGGIFDNAFCPQEANHAVLLVGYGEETHLNKFGWNETIRYWIARNSWGTSWGENGYIRIKRGPGGKGYSGICGLARSPSVALGGRALWRNRTEMESILSLSSSWGGETMENVDVDGVTRFNESQDTESPGCDKIDPGLPHDYNAYRDDDVYYISDDDYYNTDDDNGKSSYDDMARQVPSWIPRVCDRLAPAYTQAHVGCRTVGLWLDDHWAAGLGIMGVVVALLLAWPLSLEACHRQQARQLRRRQRHTKQQQQQQQQQNTHQSSSDVETANTNTNPPQDTLNESTPLLS